VSTVAIGGLLLGLNNLPRTDFTLVKSCIKNIRRREQGTEITPWQTAVKCTTVCHNRNRHLAIRNQIETLDSGNPRYDYAVILFSAWQSVVPI
jgi:hypothetical protein